MLGNIYLKLYLWFFLVFIVTLLTVAALANHFLGTTVREEIEEQLVTHARILASEYENLCGDWFTLDPGDFDCGKFLNRMSQMRDVGFWILDTDGTVRTSGVRTPPPVSPEDIHRAAQGQTVVVTKRRIPAAVILPLTNSRGRVQELFVFHRPLLRPYPPPRFPLVTSLAIAGLVIAILVIPLSLRLTKPIRELHRLGQQWAEGRLENRARIRGGGEISELANVFNKMAGNIQEMMNQRKEFLALISHELKSPLTRMKIALELLSEKGNSDENLRKKLVRDLEAEVTESENLVEQLLVLSRVEMLPPTAEFQEIKVSDFIEKAVKQVEFTAQNNEVRIHWKAVDMTISGDAEQLQRAIGNVIENAIKFSKKGGGVSVSVERKTDGIQIKVSDEGVGMDSDDYEKVFEPFYRSKTANQHQGSGLGLFIARRIIERHGGTIQASANTPTGTIFSISLPLRIA